MGSNPKMRTTRKPVSVIPAVSYRGRFLTPKLEDLDPPFICCAKKKKKKKKKKRAFNNLLSPSTRLWGTFTFITRKVGCKSVEADLRFAVASCSDQGGSSVLVLW